MKAYKGLPMEGVIATWYDRNTGRERSRFEAMAATIRNRLATGAQVLEVAPGPGYLAIELARSGYRVTGLDISRSFVEIASTKAREAGASCDFRQGNASAMPFADNQFDYVVCAAAFKNFSDPLGAINEMHRVLLPGGEASILDLRQDATHEEVKAEVQRMQLSVVNALFTSCIFRWSLLPKSYSTAQIRKVAGASRFGGCEIAIEGIGFEARFRKATAE